MPMTFDQYREDVAFNSVLVLGAAKAGKSSLVSSVSHHLKTLIVAIDKGVHSAERFLSKENLSIEPWIKFKRVMDPATKKSKMIPDPIQPDWRKRMEEIIKIAMTGGYQAVVIDDLTQLAGQGESEHAKINGIPSQQDWGKIIEGVMSFIRELQNGRFHLFCTAIAETPFEKSLVEIQPTLPGKLSKRVPGLFQVVCVIAPNKKEASRRLILNDPVMGACDRFQDYGPFVGAHSITIGDNNDDNCPANLIKILVEECGAFTRGTPMDEIDVRPFVNEKPPSTVTRTTPVRPVAKLPVARPPAMIVGKPKNNFIPIRKPAVVAGR